MMRLNVNTVVGLKTTLYIEPREKTTNRSRIEASNAKHGYLKPTAG